MWGLGLGKSEMWPLVLGESGMWALALGESGMWGLAMGEPGMWALGLGESGTWMSDGLRAVVALLEEVDANRVVEVDWMEDGGSELAGGNRF